jgi:hypothetical protein
VQGHSMTLRSGWQILNDFKEKYHSTLAASTLIIILFSKILEFSTNFFFPPKEQNYGKEKNIESSRIFYMLK